MFFFASPINKFAIVHFVARAKINMNILDQPASLVPKVIVVPLVLGLLNT